MEPDTTLPKETTRPAGRMAFVGWIVIILLLLYPLSTGPALRISQATGIVSPRQLEEFYAPLVSLCDNCPPARDLFIWYIYSLWGNSL